MYLDKEIYESCYKPQAEMRIVFECYSIYSAVLCVVLTGALAINLSDEKIEWLATKIVNISFLLYGPILSTICIYGIRDI